MWSVVLFDADQNEVFSQSMGDVVFNENEAERIRQILEENKEKGKRNAQYH